MIYLPADHPLCLSVLELLRRSDSPGEIKTGFALQRLRATRPVFRLSSTDGRVAVVGKFFSAYPPVTSQDLSLMQEYCNYQQAPAWGLTSGVPLIAPVLGQKPHLRLGLLLQDIPGPDLDFYLAKTTTSGDYSTLFTYLDQLARWLASLHSRLLTRRQVDHKPASDYFQKLQSQLQQIGLLTSREEIIFRKEINTWENLFSLWADYEVLIHGDATPTNFLYSDGGVVAVDLERLRQADRLWDLSWVAGELKHAWGWRTDNFAASEPAISHFFQAYLTSLGAEEGLAQRLFALNPFYMAMAELRIARNDYLSWDYRRALIAEAIRCLSCGR